MPPNSTDQSERNTELGLLPRVIAAGWFAFAACIPVIFFFFVFAGGANGSERTDSQGWWFFADLPVSIAALLGFTTGSRILDSTRTRSGARAIVRGVMVAALSYLGLVVINIVLAIVFSPGQSIGNESVESAVGWILIIYGIGAIYVGWIVLIAGGLAGGLLYMTSLSKTLAVSLRKAHRVRRNTVYAWTAVATLILIVANAITLLVLKW